MKNKSPEVLALRREELIARIHNQRALFTSQSRHVTGSLNWVNLGLNMVNRLKKNPVAITALVAALFVIKPRRVFALASAGVGIWKTVRMVMQGRGLQK